MRSTSSTSSSPAWSPATCQGLPPEPYPFEIDSDLASRGRDIFDANCAACHHPGNTQRYALGTDINRFEQFNEFTWEATRQALRAGCPEDAEVQTFDGESPQKPCDFTDGDGNDDVLQNTPAAEGNRRGYGATALYGLYTSSPYLHNGSVLTVLEVLAPSQRREVYVRGSLRYDSDRVGFFDAADAGVDGRIIDAWSPDLSEDELIERFAFDTRLDGLSNGGHDRDLEVAGALRRLDWNDEVDEATGLPYEGSDLEALLEFLKTL